MNSARPAEGPFWKIGLASRIWLHAIKVWIALQRHPLPRVVGYLAKPDEDASLKPTSPLRLGRAVDRVLRVGRWQPRCLIRSLVLYRLLVAEGNTPELVIGLPKDEAGHMAHAWVEVEQIDVGPPPGRNGHVELARWGHPGRQ